jgi:hypothetical protein
MNQLFQIESLLPASDGVITGSDIAGITDRLNTEQRAWQGKKEVNSEIYPRLESYWASIPQFAWNGSPDIPWSAAFISYIAKPYGLAGEASHLGYVQNVVNRKSGDWRAFSIPKNQGKIQLNVGDILVRPRSGSNTATHGDMVAMIQNGEAVLVGGNLSDSVRVVGTIPVDSSQRALENINNYLVILKKKPSKIPLILGASILLLGAGLLVRSNR